MARRPNVPCADCQTPLWAGRGSLPPGEARCRPCRRQRPGQYKPRASRPPECSYAAAHGRVTLARGRARDQTCQHCTAPAEQWAYDHTDPDERAQVQPALDGRQAYTLAFSLDPERYLALCLPCHVRFDAIWRAR